MRTTTPLVAAFITLAFALPSAAADKEKLREAARLPRVSVQCGVGFNSWNGVYLDGDDAQAKTEAALAEKTLKGDSFDAEGYLRVGDLYDRAKEGKKAKEAYGCAVELFRKQLTAQPDNAHLLTQLGRALGGADNYEEAEKVLRRAVQVGPREWLAWLNLGLRLDDRAYDHYARALGCDAAKKQDLMLLFQQVLAGQAGSKFTLSTDELETARKLEREARACFDKAVELAPKESQPYAQRAYSLSLNSFFQGCVEAVSGKEVNPLAIMMPPVAIPDLERAVQNDPGNYRLRGLLLWFHFMPAILEMRSVQLGGDKDQVLKALPEPSRQAVREQLTRLEEIAGGKDAVSAAGACEILGTASFVGLGEPKDAVEWFRKAVKLAPSHEVAWDILTAMLAGSDPKGLVLTSEERVRYKDTAYSRFLLAKAYEADNQLDKAQQAVVAVLEKEPKHFAARVGLAALLLRRNAGGPAWDRAGKLLDELTSDLTGQPPLNQQAYSLTRAIYLGLRGQHDEAEKLLQRVLEENPSLTAARDALDALAK